MSEHVRMDREWHLGGLPEPRNHSAETNGAHGRSPLAQEQVTARRLLALKPTQGAEFTAGERMDRGYAAFEPRDVQPGMGEIDLLPTEGAQLGRSQSMPEGQQDHGPIAVAISITARRLYQPLDLSLGEGIRGPDNGYWRADHGELFSLQWLEPGHAVMHSLDKFR